MVKKLLKKVGKAAAVVGAGALALKGMKKKSMPGKRGGMSLKEKIMLEKIRLVIKNVLCKILCIKQCMCKKKK